MEKSAIPVEVACALFFPKFFIRPAWESSLLFMLSQGDWGVLCDFLPAYRVAAPPPFKVGRSLWAGTDAPPHALRFLEDASGL